MPIPEKLKELLLDLELYPDRAERIDYLIEVSGQYNASDATSIPREESRRVPGCESEVFFLPEISSADELKFRFAVDNPQGLSAMALSVMLENSLSGAKKSEIAEVPEDLVYAIFGSELSMGKTMGLMNMVRMVKAEAAK